MASDNKGNLVISIRATESFTEVSLSGVIDESADFAPMVELEGKLRVSLQGVRRFNSVGIREWIDVVRELAQRTQLVFIECPPQVIDQLNMIQGFLGHARVESFFGMMECENCATSEAVLFRTRDIKDNDIAIPEVRCKQCNRVTELDEIEDQYLLFLSEPTKIQSIP
jgi:hypothetical protein